jgi:hypothetical protein
MDLSVNHRHPLMCVTPRPSDTASDGAETPFGTLCSMDSFMSYSGGAAAAAVNRRSSHCSSNSSSRYSSISDEHGTLQGLSQLQLMPLMPPSALLGVRDESHSHRASIYSAARSSRSASFNNKSLRKQISAVSTASARQKLKGSSNRSLQSVPDREEEEDEERDPNQLSSRSLPIRLDEDPEEQLLPTPPVILIQPLSRTRERQQPRGSSTAAEEDIGMAWDNVLLPADNEGEVADQELGDDGSKTAKKSCRRHAEQQERLASLEAQASSLAQIGACIEAQISQVQKEVDRLRGREMELLAIERVFAFERRTLQSKLEAKAKAVEKTL